MCGIAGVVEGSGPEDLNSNVSKMIEALRHRGPDDGAIWMDVEAGVALGHRRLAIIDLSQTGAQPMVSANGRLTVSYNGEIYNAAELRGELEQLGVRFRGHSDSEVLLEACAIWGIRRAVGRLIGMFAFAVYDRKEGSLWLVRDRIGVKPLYYSATRHRFMFASELAGLMACASFDRTIDQAAVQAFLSLNYIPSPHSIFRAARQLEPGKILRVNVARPGQLQVAPYWTLAEAAQTGAAKRFAGSFEEAVDELEQLLADAVRRRMLSDVPLGAFLSGGIDSSSVVALMQKQATQPIKTFSIGFKEKKFNEAPWAQAIAEHLGTDHTEHYITNDDIRELVPSILGHYSEPLADPSLVPTWLLSRLARRDVKVVLTGDGGDELFGGYERHSAADRIWRHLMSEGPVSDRLCEYLIPLVPRSLRSMTYRLLKHRAEGLFTPLLAADMRTLALSLRYDPEVIHYRLAHGTMQFSRGRAVAPSLATDAVAGWLKQSQSLSAAERQQYIDAAGYLPDDVLTKVDRSSMAASLEARVPLLDHRIVEFAFCLPPEMKACLMETKRVLRHVLGRHLAKPLFERSKKGFGAPVQLWLNGPLKEWTNDMMRKNSAHYRDVLESAGKKPLQLRRGRNGQHHFHQVVLAAWCEANT